MAYLIALVVFLLCLLAWLGVVTINLYVLVGLLALTMLLGGGPSLAEMRGWFHRKG